MGRVGLCCGARQRLCPVGRGASDEGCFIEPLSPLLPSSMLCVQYPARTVLWRGTQLSRVTTARIQTLPTGTLALVVGVKLAVLTE